MSAPPTGSPYVLPLSAREYTCPFVDTLSGTAFDLADPWLWDGFAQFVGLNDTHDGAGRRQLQQRSITSCASRPQRHRLP
ncbi:hypothetical protein pneo_cds_33 [Pandoravirus neocaledonia]|uniref:Uncharacterized protein n=1 Tax=Pandoravirus neocaledonia TaxID=2107708 RepID=A0A2U7UBD2_9VIRU|nr:hypothetical protein pneo_cds_33 [Pandoravirus neocaledonia]AVK75640.1 hypothetical protein pneo_cds_33 [Pandoravirus neocaledonia]